MPRTVYNQENHFLLVGSGNNHLQPFKYKGVTKVFQHILKLIETFLIQSYFYSNTKKYKHDKTTGTNFDPTTDF